MCSWYDSSIFNCGICADKPKLRDLYGCNGPPQACGDSEEWMFPELQPRVKIKLCPVQYVTTDIEDLMRAVSLAEGKLTETEKNALPVPYVDAWEMAFGECTMAKNERMKSRLKHG